MNGRERITNILNGRATDRLAWTTLIDEPTRLGMDESVRNLHPFDFYRMVGCDIMQFGDHGFYGTSQEVGLPCRLAEPDIETQAVVNTDGSEEIVRNTAWGNLKTILADGHPMKYPVETIGDLRVLKNIWANSSYIEDVSESFEKRLMKMENKIGEDGIYIHTLGPSPVQLLLEYEMGVMNFNYLLMDNPNEVTELLNIMHECRKQQYEILARRTSVECIIPVENTSTGMISPEQYEKYSLPQISDFVEIMHQYHKKAIIHMCGHLKALLPIIRKTGLDGINGLTPSPVGDTSVRDMLDVFGEDFIILGGILNSSVFHNESVSREKLWMELDNVFTPETRKANFLLWVQADGITTPLEKFITVGEWFNNHD
jgi:hypothetical protein